MTEQEAVGRLRKAEAAALVGVHEAAEMLGLKRETVHYHVRRGGFPEPIARLKCGPIWRAGDVAAWRSR